jgi:hypothetical protein
VVLYALYLFFAGYLGGVGVIADLFRENGPPLSAMWAPIARLTWATMALALGVAIRHRRPMRIAVASATVLVITSTLGFCLLAILCALGLPTSA